MALVERPCAAEAIRSVLVERKTKSRRLLYQASSCLAPQEDAVQIPSEDHQGIMWSTGLRTHYTSSHTKPLGKYIETHALFRIKSYWGNKSKMTQQKYLDGISLCREIFPTTVIDFLPSIQSYQNMIFFFMYLHWFLFFTLNYFRVYIRIDILTN